MIEETEAMAITGEKIIVRIAFAVSLPESSPVKNAIMKLIAPSAKIIIQKISQPPTPSSAFACTTYCTFSAGRGASCCGATGCFGVDMAILLYWLYD
jgi:hypothetical protein